MLRLELMPLVSDFGESFSHPIPKLIPKTHLMFTRDYRIFEQISNFPGAVDPKPKKIIQVSPLPEGFTIGSASEEDGMIFDRFDESGEITWVFASELKVLRIPPDTSSTNKAIKAYIDYLPDETRVLLKWE